MSTNLQLLRRSSIRNLKKYWFLSNIDKFYKIDGVILSLIDNDSIKVNQLFVYNKSVAKKLIKTFSSTTNFPHTMHLRAKSAPHPPALRSPSWAEQQTEYKLKSEQIWLLHSSICLCWGESPETKMITK